MTVYPTLTREYLDPYPDKRGCRNFVWYCEKDNFNDATLVVNDAYLKTRTLATKPKRFVIRKVAIFNAGTVGVKISGALSVGPPLITPCPYPLEDQFTLASNVPVIWDFGAGISLDPTDQPYTSIIVLAVAGYAATDDLDIVVEGYIET